MSDQPDQNQYAIGERFENWIYQFCCPVCGSCGKLGVPKAARDIPCPEACGARFVQWFPPLRKDYVAEPGRNLCHVALRCVNEAAARFGIEAARAHAGINGGRR
jgi:hypothetical protein